MSRNEIQIFILLIVALIAYRLSIKDINNDPLKRLEIIMADLGVLNPKVVICQMVLETGYFTSDIFIENNNPFGMKCPRSDKSCLKNRGHRSYEEYLPAFEDYVRWQKQWPKLRQRKLTDAQYLEFLDCLNARCSLRYAEDPVYTRSLRRIYFKLFKIKI